MSKPHIVILGAGYGGIMTTVHLQKILDKHEAEITLVNKNNYHYQSTLLHESAAGTLHHDRTRILIKDIVKEDRVNFINDTVISIHPEEKKVKLANDEIDYDILVIGLGFEAATYGIPGLEEHAFTIGNVTSARLIKEHIEYNFALYSNEEEKNEARLNIVIGGAGFTGMEFVGELANRIPDLCKEFDIDKAQVKIIVIEGNSTVMPGFEPELIEYATTSLEARGVEFITNARLKECKQECVIYEKDGKQIEIPTFTTIWAAGIRANKIVERSGFKTSRGKVEVRKDMRTPDFDDVFVVGDCALVINEKTKHPYPPTAQMALQEAEVIANNIKALIKNHTLKTFTPQPLGTVASLGNNDAIGVILNNRKLFGFKATVMKRLIENRYLYKLGGISLLIKKGKFNFFY